MEGINLIFASYMAVDGIDMTEQLFLQIKQDLTGAGMAIATSILVKDKDKVEECIASGKYDCVITLEELNGKAVGIGTIKKWKMVRPDLKIVVVLDDEKRGKMKLATFLSEDVQCFDSIFIEDMNNTQLLKSLIEQGRTKEEAAAYYQVTELVKQEEKKTMQQEIVDTPKDAPFRFVPQQPKKFDKSPESYNEAAARLDSLTDGEMLNLFQGLDTTGKEPKGAEEKTVGKKIAPVTDNEQQVEWIEQETSKEEKSAPFAGNFETEIDMFAGHVGNRQAVSNEKPSDSELVPIVNNKPLSSHASFKGIVTEVISEDLCVMEFESLVQIPEEKLSSYCFTVLVPTGVKGHVEGGRYVAGTMVIKAYANCFLDDRILILEVSDKNLLELAAKLTGKRCNVMMKEM